MQIWKLFPRLIQKPRKVFAQMTALSKKDWDDLDIFGPLAS